MMRRPRDLWPIEFAALAGVLVLALWAWAEFTLTSSTPASAPIAIREILIAAR